MSDTIAVEGLIESQLKEPSSDIGVFTMPCGYIDENNVLHTEVKLRGTTGVEEDMLSSKHVPADRKMDLLLGACIERVGNPEQGLYIEERRLIQGLTRKLLIGDRTFLFFGIRRVTHGDMFPFRERCPRATCSHMNTFNYDLGLLPVVPMADPMKRLYEVRLPYSRDLVRFKCVDGDAEVERDRLSGDMAPISVELQLRITDINGMPPNRLHLQAMHSQDRDYLAAEFAKVDGGVDTTVELKCQGCNIPWELDINPGQPSFFFPSASQARWKKRSSSSLGG